MPIWSEKLGLIGKSGVVEFAPGGAAYSVEYKHGSRHKAPHIARACIAGKIKNARSVLLRGAREAKKSADEAALSRGGDDLAAALRALPGIADLDALRGGEGDAARKYLACVNHLVRVDLREHFVKRKAADVWCLAAGADPKTLLVALADGVTLGPHGTPWR